MPGLVAALDLCANPFEHYVAEKEPDIAQYAVKPPYFEAINAKALLRNSYILFGDRGAGKSATRLTIFKEFWKRRGAGTQIPLAVNFLDFSCALNGKQIARADEATLVSEVAFVVIEGLLAWLSSLEDGERTTYLDAMKGDENRLCYSMLRDYYLSKPEAKRTRSAWEALALFNHAFLRQSQLWVEKKWSPIAKLIGSIAEGIAKRGAPVDVPAGEIAGVLSHDDEPGGFDAVLLLRKVVEMSRIFGFSGVVLLIDKVDETEATTNSFEKTAELVHPLLAKVQLMEVADFAWVFFLWDRVKGAFEKPYHVRLDKLSHARVSWTDDFFEQMLERRVRFYSTKRLGFADLFTPDTDVKAVLQELVSVSMRSPREMIRLMDVIVREHDVAHAHKEGTRLLDVDAIQPGLDAYVKDRITDIYDERLLAQIFRLQRTTFTNKDVQQTFKVGSPSARTRIQSWEAAGIVKLSGTRAAEGGQGGKPANEYTIVDARVARVMKRQLVTYPGEVEPEENTNLELEAEA